MIRSIGKALELMAKQYRFSFKNISSTQYMRFLFVCCRQGMWLATTLEVLHRRRVSFNTKDQKLNMRWFWRQTDCCSRSSLMLFLRKDFDMNGIKTMWLIGWDLISIVTILYTIIVWLVPHKYILIIKQIKCTTRSKYQTNWCLRLCLRSNIQANSLFPEVFFKSC